MSGKQAANDLLLPRSKGVVAPVTAQGWQKIDVSGHPSSIWNAGGGTAVTELQRICDEFVAPPTSPSVRWARPDHLAKVKMRIGVISDTHGLLRPEALAALRGSDHILHAGDIGGADILDQLRQMAPLTAVRGNVDRGRWATILPETEVVEVGRLSIYLLHDLSRLDLKPEAAGSRVVVYGHSHHPKIEEKDSVLYFNPGSAGPKRFRLPVTAGKLAIKAGKVRAQLIELESSAGGCAVDTRSLMC